MRVTNSSSLTAIWNLLKFEADPNMGDHGGCNPLIHAGKTGYKVSRVFAAIPLASRVRIDDIDDPGSSYLQ